MKIKGLITDFIDDKYAPRINDVKQEKIGIRPSEYSAWHRDLGVDYLAVDIDFVEYRKDRGIVALIDVTGNLKNENHIVNSKKYIWQRTILQRKILNNISKLIGVPSYFVLYTNDLQIFHVYDLSKNIDEFMRMDSNEYKTFIKNL